MTGVARVDQEVFDYLRPQLKEYGRQVADLERDVRLSMVAVAERADLIVAERRRQLAAAQAALDACIANCGRLVREVELCAAALERALRGRRQIEQASTKFRHSQRQHTYQTEELLRRGQQLVQSARQRIEEFQRPSSISIPHGTISYQAPRNLGDPLSGGSGGSSAAPDVIDASASRSVQTSSWQSRPGVVVPSHCPSDHALIPLDLIDDPDPVTGPEQFDGGQSIPNLMWGFQAMFDVVVPTMESTPDYRDDLRARDQNERRSGDRSYVATLDGFFGSRAPQVLTTADGRFQLEHGRHRLWIARTTGETHIPAQVRVFE